MSCWSCAVMLKIFRRSSCQKASAGTDGAHNGATKTRFLSAHKNGPGFRATGQHETAILIVSRLVADLKPGVFDAPLRGFGA
jgi:hypothetical protein